MQYYPSAAAVLGAVALPVISECDPISAMLNNNVLTTLLAHVVTDVSSLLVLQACICGPAAEELITLKTFGNELLAHPVKAATAVVYVTLRYVLGPRKTRGH